MESGSSTSEPHPRFVDPITYELMVDPVMLSDGRTVDRSTASRLSVSPWTRRPVRVVAENVDLRRDLFEEHPQQCEAYQERRVSVANALTRPLSLSDDGGDFAGFSTLQPYHSNLTGRGVQVFSDGRFEGDFRNGQRHGPGKEDRARGVRFEGEYKNGLRHGHGVQVYANGRRYEGSYRFGGKHGEAVETWPDGRRFEGSYAQDLRRGRGVCTWPNGDRFEGCYGSLSLRHGHGEYTWADGAKYIGEFVHGLRHGRGLFVDKKGRRLEGEWKRDAFVTTWPHLWRARRAAKVLPSYVMQSESGTQG